VAGSHVFTSSVPSITNKISKNGKRHLYWFHSLFSCTIHLRTSISVCTGIHTSNDYNFATSKSTLCNIVFHLSHTEFSLWRSKCAQIFHCLQIYPYLDSLAGNHFLDVVNVESMDGMVWWTNWRCSWLLFFIEKHELIKQCFSTEQLVFKHFSSIRTCVHSNDDIQSVYKCRAADKT
jgi:hypothetical protein